jgi:hypothetical protein
MHAARTFPGLVAGFLIFDVLINLPGFSALSPVVSLLAPSIDLLVVAAALVMIAQAGEGARMPLRIVVSVLLAALLGYEAAARFGLDDISRTLGFGHPVAGYVVAVIALLAAAAISWLGSGPVLRAFSFATVRSIFIVAVAVLAVLQVISRNRILEPSAIPRLFHDVASLFR